MRLLLICVMVILLPLRGWVGEAMALEMSVKSIQALQAHTLSPHAENHGNFPIAAQASNCHGDGNPLGNPVANAQSPLDAGTAGDCERCSACQACQAIAVTPTALLTLSLVAPVSHGSGGDTLFASVTLDPSLKPPIS